jgi:hypothetical protein
MQLFIILIITYYLFFFKEDRLNKKVLNKKVLNKKVLNKRVLNKKIEKFKGNTTYGSRTVNMLTVYNKNYTDLNDLSQSKPKTYYPLEFTESILNKKKIKYLKAIDQSLDMIRLLANDNKETSYNLQDRNPTPIDNNSKPFEFIANYLVEKLNLMGRNLYNVAFVKFIDINGEEIDEQYKVDLKMQFTITIKKEGFSDKKEQHFFVVKSEAVINKPNLALNTKGNIFFRSLFIDDTSVNHYAPYNI